MNQIDCAVLNLWQTLTRPQESARPAQREDQSEPSKFEKMMEEYGQREKPEGAPKQAGEAEPTEEPEAKEPVVEGLVSVQDESLWQNQMVLAAMTVVNAPAAPIQTPDEPRMEQPTVGPAVQMDGIAVTGQVQKMAQPGEAQVMEPQAEEAVPVDIPVAEEPPQAEAPVGSGIDPVAKTVERAEDPRRTDEPEMEVTVKMEIPQEQRVFGEVDTVPVKVGETNAEWHSEEAEPVEQQMMKPLSEALERGATKVEIQLAPEYLGRVKIEVTHADDGSIQVLLSAENPRTQVLLDKHAANLQNALYQQNQEPVRVVVQQPEHQQENPQQNADHQREGGQGGSQQNPRHRNDGADFLQQLRLGLAPLEDENA